MNSDSRQSLDSASFLQKALSRKVRYFLNSKWRSRSAIHDFIDNVSSAGARVAIVGGMLRELALTSIEEFRSDVDFVILSEKPNDIRNYLTSLGALKNSFGGYRFEARYWKIDAWLLQDTWAAKAGHCTVRDFPDILRTTFFNWDAILYDVSENKLLTSDEYFVSLANRQLEVNLEPNPNVRGAVLRSLRMIAKHDARLGQRLINFLARQMPNFSDEELLALERTAFASRYLTVEYLDTVRRHLAYISKKTATELPHEHSEISPSFKWKQAQLPLQ